jgi:hypothetical protein
MGYIVNENIPWVSAPIYTAKSCSYRYITSNGKQLINEVTIMEIIVLGTVFALLGLIAAGEYNIR